MKTAAVLALVIACSAACGAVTSDRGANSPGPSARPTLSEPTVRRSPGDPVRMSALTFADESHGWLLGWFAHPNVLERTVDGGETWAPVGYPAGTQLDTIGFIDVQHGFAQGWIVGDPQGCNGVAGSPRCRSAIYRSSDGGVTWSLVLARVGLGTLSVVDSRLMFATATAPECAAAYPDACGSELLRSADGGASWAVVWHGPTAVWDLQFADALVGYAVRIAGNGLVGTAQILRTADGGATWSVGLEIERSRIPALDVSHGRAWVMTLPDGACAMGGCSGYQLWRTDDGRSWRQTTSDPAWYLHPAPERPSFLGAPRFADADRGWLVAGVGAGVSSAGVLHTNDGGATWRRWTVPADLWNVGALASIDGQSAMILATELGSGHAYLMKTTDGGVTWRRLSFEP